MTDTRRYHRCCPDLSQVFEGINPLYPYAPELAALVALQQYGSGESDWEVEPGPDSEEEEEEEEPEPEPASPPSVKKEEKELATPISVSSAESDGTKARLGHFSATESEDKGSSTGTTPKESQRKLVFHRKNQTPPGHFSGASWEDHPHMDRATGKRRGPFWPDDEDPSAGTV